MWRYHKLNLTSYGFDLVILYSLIKCKSKTICAEYQHIHIFCQHASISEWVLLKASDCTTKPFLGQMKHTHGLWSGCRQWWVCVGIMWVVICIVCYFVWTCGWSFNNNEKELLHLEQINRAIQQEVLAFLITLVTNR